MCTHHAYMHVWMCVAPLESLTRGQFRFPNEREPQQLPVSIQSHGEHRMLIFWDKSSLSGQAVLGWSLCVCLQLWCEGGRSLPGTVSAPRGDTCVLTRRSPLGGKQKHARRRRAAESSSRTAAPAELPGSHELISPF